MTLRLVRRFKWMLVCMAVALVAGCGGGGSDRTCSDAPNRDPRLPSCSTGGTPPVTAESSVTLTLVDSAGVSTTTVSPTSPGVVEAKVRDTNGNPAPNIAVTFTTSDKTGGFNPTSGSALTDPTGVARITLLAGSSVGAFTLTASVEGTSTGTGGSATGVVSAGSVNLGYAVNAPNLPVTNAGSIKFVGAEPTNIALKGTGGIGRQEFSTLTFQVFDQTGHPMQRAQVNFTLSTTVGGLSLNPSSALTDAGGKAATVVSAGTMPTPIVIVTASVPNTGITTVSNVLVVSTGLAVDRRVSISTTIGNFEGWDFDSCDDKVPTVSMAAGDHFGNPVPDGTATNFTASHGFIGASCLTGAVADAGSGSGTTPPGQATNSAIGGIAGVCGVKYCSAGERPLLRVNGVDLKGRAVVLGYLRGEEDFLDANGNNVCDNCQAYGTEFFAADPNDPTRKYDLSPDIYRDDDESRHWDPNEPCIGPNANGQCSTPSDGVYNGVLANPKIPNAQQTTYLGRPYIAIWSGSNAVIKPTQMAACANFSPPGSGTDVVHVRIVDRNGNPMPAGTTVKFSGTPIVSGAITNYVVPNYLPALGQTFVGQPMIDPFIPQIRIEEYDVPISCATATNGLVTITVTTPRGIVTTATVSLQ